MKYVYKLRPSWLVKLLPFLKFEKFKVKLDKYDHWNVDHVLSPVIYKLLVTLKENSISYFLVDEEDLPEDFKSKESGDLELEGYHWVMNEMIFAFDQLNPFGKEAEWDEEFWDDATLLDKEGRERKWLRIENGTRLFGKYYSTLWD